MSDASQFINIGALKPTGLINGSSQLIGIVKLPTGGLSALGGVAKAVLTGAQTAATLSTALSLTGKGAISFLALAGVDNASRTHRAKVTLDGVVIFDATSIATANAAAVFSVIGDTADTSSTSSFILPQVFTFDQSLLIEYASSLTETAKTRIAYSYFPR